MAELGKNGKPLGGQVVKAENTQSSIAKKQKITIISLIAVGVLAIIAGIVVLSLYMAGKFDKTSVSDSAIKTKSAGNGYDMYYVTDKNAPGVYAVMTINDGERDYEIEILLMKDIAPITVNNFITYAEEGFYNETAIHRIVQGTYTFQGGGYVYNEQTHGYTLKTATHDAIAGEFKNNTSGDYSYNKISHFAGSISMARSGASSNATKAQIESAYNSATSQFFISWNNYQGWDGDYAAFGFIVDSEDVKAIKEIGMNADPDSSDKPSSPIIVKSVTIKEIK